MRTLLCLLLLLPGIQFLRAQDPVVQKGFEARLSGDLYQTPGGYTGDQYYYRDWAEGDIRLVSGEMVEDKSLKYNGFLDQLIWYDRDKTRQVKLDKGFIREFSLRLPGRTVHFRRMKIAGLLPGDSLDVFAEVLNEGPASLFVYRKVAVRGSSAQNLEGTSYVFSDLEAVPRYILQLPDHSEVIFTRIRRKNILSLLPGHYRKQVEQILKEEHLGLRNERQLAEVVRCFK